jgi:putative ABC transport system substrate-binding protein
MTSPMRRRNFITLLGGAAAAWPVAARAQQQRLPVIGFLHPVSAEEYGRPLGTLAAFHRGLGEAGYVEGRNVAIEYRWAQGRYDRLLELATDLVRRQVALIVAVGGNNSAAAAKAATATIPIVSNFGADPVTRGLVDSLSRPGGNLTGISRFTSDLLPKRLEMLREVVPNATEIAFLVNPTSLDSTQDITDVLAAAHALGRRIHVLNANSECEIDAAFLTLVERRAAALLIDNNAYFNSRSEQLARLTLRHALPAVFSVREFVVAGGLMSYAPSLADAYRQVGVYAGRVLRGEKPADLPVQQATKIEFVINLKTARTLGLTVPLPLLAFADEVIE